ncbi:MAG: hypothetical protein LBM64_01985 [Deltaproteobacteria bacterium]|jgi:hypothetical protein|nr:hypothetical protein [Deltaproteobacteria bacterium]
MRNFIWWAVYVVIAIWLQRLVPGLDALVPGLIICMKEKSQQQTVLFLIVCVLFQEGCGTLPFGSSIVWYGFAFACYYIGSWFFLVESRIFILLLSAALGVGRAAAFYGVGQLQTLQLDTSVLAAPALAQAMLTPLILWLASVSRAKIVEEASRDRKKGLEFRV